MIAAPFLFWGSVVVVGLVIWTMIHFLYRHRLEGLKEELGRERRDNERLKALAVQPAPQVSVPAEKQERKQAVAPAQKQSSALTNLPRFQVDESPVNQERVYLGANVTGSFLRAFFKDRTQHQGLQAVQPYIGKWMRVEGAVRNIWAKPKNWNVAIFNKEPDEIVGTVMMTCLPSETPKLEVMPKGDVIKAEGRLNRVEESWIYLDQARIL